MSKQHFLVHTHFITNSANFKETPVTKGEKGGEVSHTLVSV